MNRSSKRTIQIVKKELSRVRNVECHPFVIEARSKALAERKEKIDSLKSELEALKSKRLKTKPRIPILCPPWAIEACKKRWKRTTESERFLVFEWSEHFVWTGYKGKTDRGVYYPSAYELIDFHGKVLLSLESNEKSGKITGTKRKKLLSCYEEKLDYR